MKQEDVINWLGAERAAKLEREHPGAIAGGLAAFPGDAGLAALKALTLAGSAPGKDDEDKYHRRGKYGTTAVKNDKSKKQNL
jgi:hypothetical protein